MKEDTNATVEIVREFDAPMTEYLERSSLLKILYSGTMLVTVGRPLMQKIDARVGGAIKIGYSSADSSQTFDFTATIVEFDPPRRLAYRLHVDKLIEDDSRLVTYDLRQTADKTELRVEFEIEHLNDKELQRQGWSQHYDYLEDLLRKEHQE